MSKTFGAGFGGFLGALAGGPLGAAVGAGIGAWLSEEETPPRTELDPIVIPEEDGLSMTVNVRAGEAGARLLVIRVVDEAGICLGVPPFADERGRFLLLAKVGAGSARFFLPSDAVLASRVGSATVLGYLVDRAGSVLEVMEARVRLPPLRPFLRTTYARALIVLAAQFACAGGEDARQAWSGLREILARYLSVADERELDAAARGATLGADIERTAADVVLRHPDLDGASILRLLLAAGPLDGGMTPARGAVLREAARGLGVSPSDLDELAREAGVALDSVDRQWRSDLSILGIGPDHDADGLRSAYRSRLHEAHPDRHARHGSMAEEVATRRTVEIKEAYDRLRATQGQRAPKVPPVAKPPSEADIDASLAAFLAEFRQVQAHAAEQEFPFSVGPAPFRNQVERAPEFVRRHIDQWRVRVDRWAQHRQALSALQRRAIAARGSPLFVSMLDNPDVVEAFEQMVADAESRPRPVSEPSGPASDPAPAAAPSSSPPAPPRSNFDARPVSDGEFHSQLEAGMLGGGLAAIVGFAVAKATAGVAGDTPSVGMFLLSAPASGIFLLIGVLGLLVVVGCAFLRFTD